MFSPSTGLFVLIFLSIFAWIGAVAVAGRARMDGRIEQLLAATLVWMGLTVVPTYGLAWAGWLYRPVVAAVSFACSALAIGLSGWGRRPRKHLREVLVDTLALARLPVDALVMVTKLRGFACLSAAVSALAIVWTGWLAYLGPPSSWDGLWYHDSIVGFAIQNHGFRIVDVPQSLAMVNSFPRICETLNLWFVLFGDRRLLDFPNTMMAVPLLAGAYLLVRRYARDADYAAASATGMLLMPGVVLQLRSTYIDLTILSLTVVAMHFATRPNLRLRDVWLASLGLGLVLATKFMAAAQVPLLGLVLAVRLFARHWPLRRAATFATALGGAVVVAAIGAPNYLRNLFHFGHILWPYSDASEHVAAAATSLSNSNHVYAQLFGEMLSQPVPGQDWPDIRQRGYGLAVPLLLFPLGICGALAAPFAAGTAALRREYFGRTRNLLYTTFPMLMTIPFSPTLSYARYNQHIVIAFLLLASWILGNEAWARFRRGTSATLVVLSLVSLWWASPRWGMTWAQAIELLHMTPLERAGAHVVPFLPEPKVVHARETELKDGDIVVFTDAYTFPAVNWNERYTTRVVWVSSALGPEHVLDEAAELGAKWISVMTYSAEYGLLKSRPEAWQEVGYLSTATPQQVAFRRLAEPTSHLSPAEQAAAVAAAPP